MIKYLIHVISQKVMLIPFFQPSPWTTAEMKRKFISQETRGVSLDIQVNGNITPQNGQFQTKLKFHSISLMM